MRIAGNLAVSSLAGQPVVWLDCCRMAELSEERLAPVNGIEIAYQEVGDPDGEPLILVMGLATQMLAWDEEFCALLAERGFRVVRFDNRDIGHSTMLDAAGVPSRLDMLRRPPRAAPPTCSPTWPTTRSG